MFVVVNFDALAQASDIRIEKTQVFFLCWIRIWKSQDTHSPADWMSTHKPTELSRIKQKTWAQQSVPRMSGHPATWQARDSRIETRQVVFLCWVQDSNLEVSRHLFAGRLNTHWQTNWAIEDQAKNLNSTAHAYDEWAFSPLDFTAVWLSHLALAIYMFVVVYFDALAQESDFKIERRQVVLLCWMQDLNQGLWNRISSRLNARWQTYWAIEDQAKSLNSTAHPYDQRAFSPLDFIAVWFRAWLWRYTCLLLFISMLWHRQAYKLKTWTQQPVPMISKHSAHLTPLPFGIRTWLWCR